MQINPDEFRKFCEGFSDCANDGVQSRVHVQKRPDWLIGEVSSVITGHLSRLSTLAVELASSPMSWNGHVAPLVLRSMVDCLISLRWILIEPAKRSREFIGYGLGQAKLLVAHLEEKLTEQPDDEAVQLMIDGKKDWIQSQILLPFVDVNLGSWSGSSVRKMAAEAGDEDLYHFAFSPFSACVHNSWEHMHPYDTQACDNPLHRRHRIPFRLDDGISPDYLFRAAKYLTLAFDSFDKSVSHVSDLRSPRNFFDGEIGKIFLDRDELFADEAGVTGGRGGSELR
jgi:Family of unknown function (DUF5677)